MLCFSYSVVDCQEGVRQFSFFVACYCFIVPLSSLKVLSLLSFSVYVERQVNILEVKCSGFVSIRPLLVSCYKPNMCSRYVEISGLLSNECTEAAKCFLSSWLFHVPSFFFLFFTDCRLHLTVEVGITSPEDR